MSRSQSATSRAKAEATSPTTFPEFCVLDCRDLENNRRKTKKESTLCDVCDKRITRQAKQSAHWRALWRHIYEARSGGLDLAARHGRK
jgi:hypothetical protein